MKNICYFYSFLKNIPMSKPDNNTNLIKQILNNFIKSLSIFFQWKLKLDAHRFWLSPTGWGQSVTRDPHTKSGNQTLRFGKQSGL